MIPRALAIMALLLVALPASASVPSAAFFAGRVDSATGCAPVALGDACLAWSEPGPHKGFNGAGRQLILADHGKVYELSVAGSFAVELDARDAATGALEWTRTFSPFDDGYQIVASPDGALVYAALANSGSWGSIVGLDAATGATVWSAPAVASEIVVKQGTLFDIRGETSNSNIEARDAATGALLWTAPTVERIGSPHRDAALSADGSTLFLLHQRAAAYSTQDGSLLWTRALSNVGSLYVSAFVVDDARGQLVASVVGVRGTGAPDALLGLDAATGATRWTVADGIDGLALAGDVLVATEFQGVAGYSAMDGALLWTESVVENPPDVFTTCDGVVAAHGVAYVACGYGLVALDAATGGVLWNTSESVERLAVGDGMVFATLVKSDAFLSASERIEAYREAPGLLAHLG